MVLSPNTMRKFTFNGISSDTYFYTMEIERSILPPVEYESITVPARHGSYPVRSRFEEREISIGVSLLKSNWSELRSAVRQIASWLYTESDQRLIFSDEPDKYYMARLSGDTNLDELLYYGETNLTFVCSDPFAYSLIEKSKEEDVVKPNLVPEGDFVNSGNYSLWSNWQFTNSTSGSIRVLEDGTPLNILTVYSNNSTLSSTPFGIQSTTKFPVVKGRTYTFSCLVGMSGFTQNRLNATFLVPITNTSATSQSIVGGEESTITNHQYVGTTNESYPRPMYFFIHTFTAEFTDSEAVLIVGGRTADTTSTGSRGYFYVGDIKLEEGSIATRVGQSTIFSNNGSFKVYPRIRVKPTQSNIPYLKFYKGLETLLINGPITPNEAIIIDHNSNLVYNETTGARMLNKLDISSNFFALDVGDNLIRIEPTGVSLPFKVYWRERYL